MDRCYARYASDRLSVNMETMLWGYSGNYHDLERYAGLRVLRIWRKDTWLIRITAADREREMPFDAGAPPVGQGRVTTVDELYIEGVNARGRVQRLHAGEFSPENLSKLQQDVARAVANLPSHLRYSYETSIKDVVPADLAGFFVGWPNPPDTQMHFRILKDSHAVVLARSGQKVVGFVHAISDRHLSAYIPLLEVLPDYQGQGIGGELVRRITEQLKDFYMLDLCCDEDLKGFYEPLGFTNSSPAGRVAGMIMRRYEQQAGR